MSYTVLARRYRSTGFDDVVGQDHVAQTLKRAITTGRIAHAFLFCGTRGVGKTSMARILAKALNCQKHDGPTAQPCGKCASCEAIARGDDMDVIEIDAASNTGVDNVRNIIDNARYRPAHSRFRVFIVDEVHMLSKSAFNALLKTLEEPPGHVKFILATTEPEKVPATILSRCQRYDFRSISTRQIADHLAAICKSEKVKADEQALLLIAKAGAGSMRDALSLLDRLLSSGTALTAETVEQMLGLPRSELLSGLVDAIGRGDLTVVLTSTQKALDSGLSVDALLAGLIDHLRTLLVMRVCGKDAKAMELLDATERAAEALAEQAGRFAPALLSQDIAILEELRRQLRSTQAGRALLDATLVRLALAEQFRPIDELLANDTGSKKNCETSGHGLKPRDNVARSAPVETPSRPDSADRGDSGVIDEQRDSEETTSNVTPVDAADLPAVRQAMLDLLTQRGQALASLVADAQLVGIEDDRAVLRYRPEHATFVRMLERNGKQDLVRDAFSQVLGRPVGLQLSIESAESSVTPLPPASVPAKPAQSQAQSPPPPVEPASGSIAVTNELRQSLRASEPLVRRLMDDLAAEIVRVE
jgi:DNA polymerase III subunit gamma/tau